MKSMNGTQQNDIMSGSENVQGPMWGFAPEFRKYLHCHGISLFGVGVLLIWGQEIETLLGITDIKPSLS